MTYRAAVPALTQLPHVTIAPAPAVQAATPLDERDIYEAMREEKYRYQTHKSDPVAVPWVETVRAKLRTDDIVKQHLAVMQPGGNAPQWAVDLQQQIERNVRDQLQQAGHLMAQELQRVDTHLLQVDQRVQRVTQDLQRVDTRLHGVDQRVQRVDTRLHGVDQRVQDLDQRVQQVEQSVTQLTTTTTTMNGAIQGVQNQLTTIQEEQQRTNAILHNTRAAASNARTIENGVVNIQPLPFHPFVKVIPGLGNALPRAPVPLAPIPALQVGEVVPQQFSQKTTQF